MASTEGWLRNIPAQVAGWGKNIGDRIQGAWDGANAAASPGGSDDMLKGIKDGWNGDLPDKTVVSSSPNGEALRGGGPDPTPQADAVRPARSRLRTGMNPADFTVSPDGTTVPRSVGEVALRDGARAVPPEGAPTGAPRPAWGAGPSPEAQAFNASRAAPPAGAPPGGAPAPKVPAQGMIRGAVAKAAGPLAVGAEFLDPNVRAAVDPTSDVSITDRLKQASRTALRVGGGMLGGIGGAALGSAVPVAGTIAGGVAGGYAGYEAGNKVADYLVGAENKPPAAAPSGVGGTAPATPPPPGPGNVQGNTGSGFQPLSGKAKVNANAFINGTGVPQEGEGYFRNNQTGGISHLASDGSPRLRGSSATPAGDSVAPFRKLAGKGAFGNIAALSGYGALDRMKANTVNAQLRGAQAQATNELARARMGYEMYRDERAYNTGREDYNTKIANDDITNYVKSVEPGQNLSVIGGEKPGDYESRIGVAHGKLSDQIAYSLGNRNDGKRLGQLSGTERQQLLMGAKMKANLEKSRSGMLNSAADFFGNKRADSKDLYSYIPSGVEGSVQPFSGGYRVKTVNGNTLTVRDAAGGGFNWTGPNDPVDADVMAMIGPYIKQARAQGK